MVKKASGKASASSLPSWTVTPASSLGSGGSEASEFLLESPAAKGVKRHQLARRDTEDQCERALDLHFSAFTKSQLESIKIEGLTARERILRDLREKKSANARKRFGATYWRSLVQQYSEKLTKAGHLEVRDQTQPVRDSLAQALDSATRKNPATRSIKPLVSLLQQCTVLNQREFVGMCLAANSCAQMLGRCNSDTIYIEMLRYIVRHSQHASLKDEIEILKPKFDLAMSRQWLRLKKAGVAVLTWLSTHLDLVVLLLDRGDVEAVMSARGSWQSVGPQVARLTSSGHLDQALFSFAGHLVNSSAFGEEVDAAVARFAKEQITMAKLATVQAECEAIVERGCGVLAEKRKVHISFLGHDLEVIVQAPAVECEMKLNAALERLAIGQDGGLEMLMYEKWFLDVAGPNACPCALPEAILKPMQAARKCANDILFDPKVSSFADVRKLLISNASTLISLDRYFKLELDFVQGPCERVLADAMDSKLLACLPTQTLAVSYEQAISSLNLLQKSKFHDMSSSSMQARAPVVVEMVANMSRGIAPDANCGTHSEFFATVLKRLEAFARQKMPTAEGSDEVVIIGQAALNEQMKQIKLLFEEDPESVRLLDLEPFHAFKWLLSDVQQQLLAEWVKTALRRAASHAQALGSSSASGSASASSVLSKTSRKGAAAAKDGKKDIMSFFG